MLCGYIIIVVSDVKFLPYVIPDDVLVFFEIGDDIFYFILKLTYKILLLGHLDIFNGNPKNSFLKKPF